MNIKNTQTHQPPFSLRTFITELDDASLHAIQSVMVRRMYQKGEYVCFEGEACPGLLIIESGWIKGVKAAPKGREQEIRLAGPGEVINEISVMVGGDNLLTLQSLAETVLWVIKRSDVFHLINKYPAINNTITKHLAKQGEHLLNLLADLALRPVDSRLAHLLLNHSREETVLRENWFTEAEMAASIGTTSVIVSRVLNEMEGAGIIHLERHKITILDHKMLERMVFQKYKRSK